MLKVKIECRAECANTIGNGRVPVFSMRWGKCLVNKNYNKIMLYVFLNVTISCMYIFVDINIITLYILLS